MKAVVTCENGTFGSWRAECPAACEYFDSCRLVTTSPDPDSGRRVRNAVSYEKNSFRTSTGPNQFPAEEEDDNSQVISIGPEDNIAGLMEMLTYLVMLDDNTAAAMCEIIRNPNVSQAEIARKRGVSRQRINTALLYACRKHPELGQLFQLAVKKITIANNRYIRRKTAERPEDQLELPGLR